MKMELTCSHQESFRKSALGLLAVAEVGREDGVRAVCAFERTVGVGVLKLSFFRGFETLLPLDMSVVMSEICSMFFKKG